MIYRLNFLYLCIGKKKGKAKLDATFILENRICVLCMGAYLFIIYWTYGSLHIF